MIKILKNKQIREIDQLTIQYEPIKSIDLMERAAERLLEKIIQLFPGQYQYSLFAGPGNNGGDVVAIYRLMCKRNIQAQLFVVNPSDKFSSDCQENLDKLKYLNISYNRWKTISDFQHLEDNSIIIDGIFGSGLSKPVDGFYAALIDYLNVLPNKKIAIDIPSGLFDDDNSQNDGAIAYADITLSLQFPKLSFLFPENEKFVGDWHIIDINLLSEAINKTTTSDFFTEAGDIKQTLKKRDRFSHKGNFGHALIVAGSEGKYGAMILATKSCLRSGVGLVSVCNKMPVAPIVHSSIPEAMFIPADSIILQPFSTIGIGPGLGTEKNAQVFLEHIISNTKKPLVIDADAINILSMRQDMLLKVPENSILTPHVGEFERLVGKCSSGFERLVKAKKFAQEHNIVLVLKGANTAIIDTNGNSYFNPTGNPGMSTGGSGDVLTGLITGILASGYQSLHAAILGVYIHGLAGDLALKTQSYESLIASDIINQIGKAFIQIHHL